MDQNAIYLTQMPRISRIPIFHIFSSCVLNFTVVFITTKIPSCREEWFLSGGFMEVSIVATGLSLNSFAVENLWTCCGIFRHAVSGIQRPLMLPTSQLDVPLTWCQRVVRFRRHVGGGSIPGQGNIKWQSSSRPALWYLRNVRCSLLDPLFQLDSKQDKKSFRNQVHALTKQFCLGFGNERIWKQNTHIFRCWLNFQLVVGRVFFPPESLQQQYGHHSPCLATP